MAALNTEFIVPTIRYNGSAGAKEFVTAGGVVINACDATTGWSSAGGSQALNTDLNFVKVGTGSLKVTSTSGGVDTDLAISPALDLSSGGNLSLWFYNTKAEAAISFFIKITSSGAAFTNVNTYQFYIRPGWNHLIVQRNNPTSTGGTLNWAAVDRIRFTCNGITTGDIVYYDDLRYGYYAMPQILVTFDDAYANVVTNALPVMNTYGIKGTYYVWTNQVNEVGKLTTANLTTLKTNGWAISNHSNSHPDYTAGVSVADAITEYTAAQDWLIANGFTVDNSHKFVAYPSGAHPANVITAMETMGVKMSRIAVDNNPYDSHKSMNTELRQSTMGYFCRGNGPYRTPATILAAVDKAINGGGVLQLIFHSITGTTGDTGDSLIYGVTDFTTVMEGLAKRRDGGLCDLPTVTQYYKKLISGRSTR